MSRSPDLPRRYDDDEVARILKRATEIRRRRSHPSSFRGQEGLTLAELEEIAAEAGIDITHLRQAALEVDTGTDRHGVLERVVGGPFSVVQEEVVEGELDEDGFQLVLAALQQGLGEFGQPSLMARTLTWKNETTRNGGRSTMATISVREGRTTVRIEESYQQVAGGLQGGITVGAGVGFGVGLGVPLGLGVGSVLASVLFPVGALVGAYAVARGAYRGYVGKRRRKVAEVLTRVVEVVRQEATPSDTPRAVGGTGDDARLPPAAGGSTGDGGGESSEPEGEGPSRPGPGGALL